MHDDTHPANRHDPALNAAPYPSSAQLWPLRAAAAYVGLPAEALAKGIESGDIPVLMRTLGDQNKRFVNIHQLREWATARPAPARAQAEESLF